jgi:hypothetical protein
LVIEKGMESSGDEPWIWDFVKRHFRQGECKVDGHPLSIVNLLCIWKPFWNPFFKNELVSTPPFFMTYLCFWWWWVAICYKALFRYSLQTLQETSTSIWISIKNRLGIQASLVKSWNKFQESLFGSDGEALFLKCLRWRKRTIECHSFTRHYLRRISPRNTETPRQWFDPA